MGVANRTPEHGARLREAGLVSPLVERQVSASVSLQFSATYRGLCEADGRHPEPSERHRERACQCLQQCGSGC